MSETPARQKNEVGGMPLRVAGVTIRLIEIDRRNQAAFVAVEVDATPRFVKPSEVLLNRPA